VPDVGAFVGGIVDGIVSFGGDVIGTAVGAVMSWVGNVVNGLASVVAGILGYLPDATDLGLSIPSGWLVGYAWLNGFVPLGEMIAFIAILAAAQLGPIVWHSLVTVYHLIPKPFIGT